MASGMKQIEQAIMRYANPTAGTYLKAGEYGETEYDNSWSAFKEPFNAYTSLSYSAFGLYVFYTGCCDVYALSNAAEPDDLERKMNRLQEFPAFSLLIGWSLIYLGISSFLFHASHAETWRKADAGMTSGVLFPFVAFTIWDRLRPPAMGVEVFIGLACLAIASMTHGYVAYGMSDYVSDVEKE
jgi:hypothetical protein